MNKVFSLFWYLFIHFFGGMFLLPSLPFCAPTFFFLLSTAHCVLPPFSEEPANMFIWVLRSRRRQFFLIVKRWVEEGEQNSAQGTLWQIMRVGLWTRRTAHDALDGLNSYGNHWVVAPGDHNANNGFPGRRLLCEAPRVNWPNIWSWKR